MKTIKLLSVAFAMAFAMNVNAQSETSYYDGYGKDKRWTHEVSFYAADAWGFGYQLRREINPNFALNLVSISYLTGAKCERDKESINDHPGDTGSMNIRLLGVRGNYPLWKSIRAYTDLNMGYTWCYCNDTSEFTHHFGYDFGVGLQLHKRFAVGYSMTYKTAGETCYGHHHEGGTTHYCKFSVLF